MRLFWISLVCPISNDKYPFNTRENTQTYKRKKCVRKTEIRVIELRKPRNLYSHQELEEVGSPLEPSEESQPF